MMFHSLVNKNLIVLGSCCGASEIKHFKALTRLHWAALHNPVVNYCPTTSRPHCVLFLT